MTTEQRVYAKALSLGVPDTLAKLIVAQSKHETGNYMSNAFLRNKNLFGYKYVGQKNATQGIKSSESDYYANYVSIDDSVTELVNWIKRRQKEGKFPANLASITTAETYATLLKNANYYGDKLQVYVNGLKKFFKNNIVLTTSLALPLLVGVILYYLVNR